MREHVKGAVRAAGRTGPGRTLVHAAVVGDPRDNRFTTVRWLPERIDGFEDLLFLFSSNQLNHGVISQELDEAGLLYRLARGAATRPWSRSAASRAGRRSCSPPRSARAHTSGRTTSTSARRALHGRRPRPRAPRDARALRAGPGRPRRRRLAHGRAAAAGCRPDPHRRRPQLRRRARRLGALAPAPRARRRRPLPRRARPRRARHVRPRRGALRGGAGTGRRLQRQANAGGIAHFAYRPTTSDRPPR